MAATLAYNGLALDTFPYSIDSFDNLIGGDDIRTSDMPYVGRSGVIAGRDFLGGKSLTLTINIRADSDQAFNDAVSAIVAAFSMPATVELPLTYQILGVANNQPAQTLARTRRVSLPYATGWQSGHVAQMVVELFATDGSKYSQVLNSATISAPIPSGGFTWPFTWSFTWPGVTGGSVTIINNGNLPTAPIITINGPLTNPVITLVSTGDRLAFTYDLLAGSTFTLDANTRSVLLNGTANGYPYLTEADWFNLAPGANQVALTAFAGSGNATVAWRDRWV